MDITSLVSLPVWIMEPFTMLQKMAEIMEYTDRLDRALECDDPYIRQVQVLAQQLICSATAQRLDRRNFQTC